MVYKVYGISVWANKPFDISRESHKESCESYSIKRRALRDAGTYFLTHNSKFSRDPVNDVFESTEA